MIHPTTHPRLALRLAVVSTVALALLLALPACRRRRVARTSTVPSEASMMASTSPAVTLANAARRALGCGQHEAWPLAPRLVLVEGCGRAIELFMIDDAGSLWLPVPSVTALAADQLSCPAHALDTVVLPGVARRVSGCGRSREYELRCRAATCAWSSRGAEAHVPAGYASAAAPSVGAAAPATQPTPDAPASTLVQAPSPPQAAAAPTPRSDAGSAVAARIEQSRDALQRCAWGSYTIRARWNRLGGVAFSLSPPLAGTPAELCVRAALGMDHLETTEAGELDVVVP